MTFSSSELEDIRTAKVLLENAGLAAKLSNLVGVPIEKGFESLPKKWNVVVKDATRKSIETALDVALWTMDHGQRESASNWWHKLAVGTTGALGGAFGLPALAIELPVSTTIMLTTKKSNVFKICKQCGRLTRALQATTPKRRGA